jgi:hypothetical protein
MRVFGETDVNVKITIAAAVACMAAAFAPGAAAFSGLPDGRVYEQVSPTDKNGNVLLPAGFLFNEEGALGSEDGNAVMYLATGAVGAEADQGTVEEVVSRRTPGSGWSSAPADPRQLGKITLFGSLSPPGFYPSRDFSRVLFDAASSGSEYPAYAAEEPVGGGDLHLYLSSDPLAPPLWLGRPDIAEPLPAGGAVAPEWSVAGLAPDASTVWFSYSGTLLPEDETSGRTALAGNGLGSGPWGFYEWHGPASASEPAPEPTLSEAGVLPNEELSPHGAVAAAFAGHGGLGELPAEDFDNQVSADGTRAFFVSPQPGKGAPAGEPPELYVRETLPSGERRSVLVSRSALPGQEEEAAPHGVVAFANASGPHSGGSTYVYASPDGSHAVFASTDRLTSDAPEGSSVKLYDLSVQSGELTWLPGVAGQIAASSSDGSRLLFVKSGSPPELDLWSAGPEGGTVETITPLSSAEVTPARASSDGSVFLFYASGAAGALKGFNSGGFAQFYRWDAASSTLSCVSCAPAGTAPAGPAETNFNTADRSLQPVRMMSADGSRVFFGSPDPLLPTDVNGRPDVYEWEDGRVYLISSGASPAPSRFLDGSETGGDVFFETEQSLVPGDTDETADVYDARVPRPGDSPPPAPAPCSGDECLGPPPVPWSVGAGGSATYEGRGNIPPAEAKPAPKPKPKPKPKHKHRRRRRRHK